MFKLKPIILFAVLLAVLSLTAADTKAKYVFLFIGDGMGETVRKYYQHEFPDSSLEKFPVTVHTGTNNVKNTVTDSAASGTAIACGIKTYNGAVGVNKDAVPVTSLAKILRDKGLAIGIITSVGLNDATPAAHYANRLKRSDSAGTLSDLFASNFDFFAGGFLLKHKNYKTREYALLLKQVNYEFRNSYNFDKHAIKKRVVYVAPMEPDWPQAPQKLHLLSEVVAAGIKTLQDDSQGFFMMVEGGAIDHRNHNNDLAGSMREMHEFDLAVKTALEFQQKHPQDTLIVITSDHDTGGLNINGFKQSSLWKKQANRAIYAESTFKKMLNKQPDEAVIKFLADYFGMGELSADEQKAMQEALRIYRDPKLSKAVEYRSMYGKYNPVVVQMMRLRDARCGVSWTGFNHTTRKVLTNAKGCGEEYFKNVKENSDIPHAISRAVLGEDMMDKAAVTLPQLVEKKQEEYFNFISINCNKAIFRYGQKNADTLEMTFTGKDVNLTVKRNDRAGRVTFDKLTADTQYTLSVKRNGKIVFNGKVKTLPAMAEKPLVRMGVIADPHISVKPDVRYGRMHSKSAETLTNACKKFAGQKVDFIAIPGDVTDASKLDELKATVKALAQTPGMKFYAIPGNHDYGLANDKFKALWIKTFGPTVRLEKHNSVQILLLDTGNGKLADKPANIQAIEALDKNLPVIVFSHYQLTPDSYIQDPERMISDPEAAKDILQKLAAMKGAVLVGHKNIATTTKLGNLWQINLPQLTQFPAGAIYAEVYSSGIRLEFQPMLDTFFDEYGRIRGNALGQKARFRDRHSLVTWNKFYPF